jgi:hypothetical protein
MFEPSSSDRPERRTRRHAAGLGEAYTFVGFAMPSRFVVTWKVGKRNEETAMDFLADLRARLVVMPRMTSDGFVSYIPAIGKHMGPGVDYFKGVKHYTKGGRRDDDHRYEPPRQPFLTKQIIFGAPNLDERAAAGHPRAAFRRPRAAAVCPVLAALDDPGLTRGGAPPVS